MKTFVSTLISLTLFIGIGVFTVHAQSYTPLAPLPGTTVTDASGVQTTDMGTYISGIIKLIIALGAATAILFAIIGGTQYVAASINPAAKSDALGKIQNAVIGLLVILSSYLILHSIDPKLVEFNLTLKKVTPAKLDSFAALTPEQQNAILANTTGYEGNTPGEAIARGKLVNVSVNNSHACPAGMTFQDFRKSVNDAYGCTTIEGLGGRAIQGVNTLVIQCLGCAVRISGGYELGHQTHGPHYENNLDLSATSDLSAFIKNTGILLDTTKPQTCGVPAAPHYTIGSATYVEEDSVHWHVCY